MGSVMELAPVSWFAPVRGLDVEPLSRLPGCRRLALAREGVPDDGDGRKGTPCMRVPLGRSHARARPRPGRVRVTVVEGHGSPQAIGFLSGGLRNDRRRDCFFCYGYLLMDDAR